MPGLGSMITLTDKTTGSELFGGSTIYCYGANINFGTANNVQTKSRTLVDTDIQTTESLGSHWNRRKGYSSYVSTNNPNLVLSCRWTKDVGSEQAGSLILTPFKLKRMSDTPHTYYLKDDLLIQNLIDGEYGSSYYGSDGMPVVITDYGLNRSLEDGDNSVTMSVTFREDRED